MFVSDNNEIGAAPKKNRPGSVKSMRDLYRCDFCGHEENTGTTGNLICGRLANGLDYQFCVHCQERLKIKTTADIERHYKNGETFTVKENTHIVIKEDDIRKHLSNEEQKIFDMLYEKIMLGRYSEGRTNALYYVVNRDEPYSEKILDVIRDGEVEKNRKGEK